MHKKGMTLWEVIIWAMILLIVAVVVIYAFQKLFGKESTAISDEIELTKDEDRDLIPNKFDCCDREYGSASNKGCPDNKPWNQQPECKSTP